MSDGDFMVLIHGHARSLAAVPATLVDASVGVLISRPLPSPSQISRPLHPFSPQGLNFCVPRMSYFFSVYPPQLEIQIRRAGRSVISNLMGLLFLQEQIMCVYVRVCVCVCVFV